MNNPLVAIAIQAAEQACKEILLVYHSGNFQAEAKGDNSPLTLADKNAHRCIVEILQPSGFPILSEEGARIDYNERKNWETFWMVDPLDGTKEFIQRNGEFTVNIALIKNNQPVLGVVAVPVTGDVFFASRHEGAYKKSGDALTKLSIKKPLNLGQKNIRVVASRSHMNERTQNYIARFNDPVLVSRGSSLKFILLTDDQADIYPRFGPTMEWDTAAAHAIVNEVGLKVYKPETDEELTYNKPDLLNPDFIVC